MTPCTKYLFLIYYTLTTELFPPPALAEVGIPQKPAPGDAPVGDAAHCVPAVMTAGNPCSLKILVWIMKFPFALSTVLCQYPYKIVIFFIFPFNREFFKGFFALLLWIISVTLYITIYIVVVSATIIIYATIMSCKPRSGRVENISTVAALVANI